MLLSLDKVLSLEDLHMLFSLPLLFPVVSWYFRMTLMEMPTPAACRWMIRELVFAFVLITLTPQIFLTGCVLLAPWTGYQLAVLCMLLVAIIVITVTTVPSAWRYNKMLARQLPDDDPREHARLAWLVNFTTQMMQWYVFIASFVVLIYFNIPYSSYEASLRSDYSSRVLASAPLLDSLCIYTFPFLIRLALLNYLYFAKDRERFEKRRDGFFGTLEREPENVTK